MENYCDFLKSKEFKYMDSGFYVDTKDMNKNLFDFQKAIVQWALKRGRCALFMDTGLGKTICQLEFAQQIINKFGGKVLILAPLAVSRQTAAEGRKFGYSVNVCKTSDDVKDGINITNYDRIHLFNSDDFIGIILDESSIIKNFQGKTYLSLIQAFRYTQFKLACTATPSPNDYQEIGNHSEFLNIMSRTEMLATFFINDSKETHWRLKRHAENKFWEWLAKWAVVIKNPADIGFNGDKYVLPELNIENLFVSSPKTKNSLVAKKAKTLSERREARHLNLDNKVSLIKDLVSKLDNCLIFVDFNDEGDAISKTCNIAQVKGSDSDDYKEKTLLDFADGKINYLVSKPSIAGFGLNFQNCNNIIFCGLSDSYERFYQSIRRCYRFGQTKPVNVYVILGKSELNVLYNLKNKEAMHIKMSENMLKKVSGILKAEFNNDVISYDAYIANTNIVIPKWLVSEGEY